MKKTSDKLKSTTATSKSVALLPGMTRQETMKYALRVAVCFLTLGFVFTDALNS
jgi:hypothetical protein